MKKIDLLGVVIKIFTLSEELKIAHTFLYSGGLNTISYLSAQMLVEAKDNPAQKEWIESKDMVICGEIPILEAANLLTRNKIREVENKEFLTNFIRSLVRNKKRIYLVGKNQKEIEKLEKSLKLYDEKLKIASTYIVNLNNINHDALVNDINDVVPHVIISKLPYPLQDKLIFDNEKIINANIWLTLFENMEMKTLHKKSSISLTRILGKKLFNRRVHKYNIEKNGK